MRLFGASVRGPSHVVDKLPNQDAWYKGVVGGYGLVVVCDGLGSKKHSDVGAKAACKSVRQAFVHWTKSPSAPPETLLALIHVLWKLNTAALQADDCACTCLFAAVNVDGHGIAAQLGDGMILLGNPGKYSVLKGRDESEFSNRTAALGVTKKLSAWKHMVIEPPFSSVMLCTDGISDDLERESLSDFFEWLLTDIGSLPPKERWHRLRQELLDWPTPRHLDDKTIAVLDIRKQTQ